MKILLVIDHFGSGGAQRQIVELACGLKRKGHVVEMFVYHPQHDFFRPRLDELKIPVNQFAKSSGFSFGVVRTLSKLMRSEGFDVVVSYLSDANMYAELAKLVAGKPALVVSERSSHHDDNSWCLDTVRRFMHNAADHVVANSVTHCKWLRTRPGLSDKVSCIYNGIDTEKFGFAPLFPDSVDALRLVGIGRVGPEKNLSNLVLALNMLFESFGQAPRVDWVGSHESAGSEGKYFHEVSALLEKFPAIRGRWRWLGVRNDVQLLLPEYHALIHPSLYEGLPNVVCEALAVGKPILISDVCDHSLLVAENQRGFLFTPSEPESISRAIRKLTAMDTNSWQDFCENAREYAVKNLRVDRMVASYESLFERLTDGKSDANTEPSGLRQR